MLGSGSLARARSMLSPGEHARHSVCTQPSGLLGLPPQLSGPYVPCAVLGAPSPTIPRTRVARHPSAGPAELVPWVGAPWTVLSVTVVRRIHPQAHAAHGRLGGSTGPGWGSQPTVGAGMGSVPSPLPFGFRGQGYDRGDVWRVTISLLRGMVCFISLYFWKWYWGTDKENAIS